MRAAATMLFGLWLGVQARAEDASCEQLAAARGLTGNDHASFVERCRKGDKQGGAPRDGSVQPKVDTPRDARARTDRDFTRERSDRDGAATPLLRPGR